MNVTEKGNKVTFGNIPMLPKKFRAYAGLKPMVTK